ncbi:hypothetical protein QR680_010178 [Steinernema hermaphroditum]|uniref:Saposin B-type domain-containing protein n=1 Tax=Steinernema hermaphroditum TaxID=289476 RepID=A0AA39IQI3_9BILA|nr:hypothetical protein QR680_010178 [Steinernema hermaphroditum]
MRTLVVLAALVAVSLAVARLPSKLDSITDRMECVLCEDIVKDSEKWVGDEEQSKEKSIIKKCENFFGGSGNPLAKGVCDGLAEKWLDKIIKHMEDPNSEKQDSKKACQDIGMCKQ